MSNYLFKSTSITTLHGLSNLTNGGGRIRPGWMAIFLGNAFFTIYLFLVIKERFDSNQIYTRVDATCRVNQVPFPSVIICNANIVSSEESKNIQNILKSRGRNSSEIESFFAALTHLTYNGFGSERVGKFTDIMEIMRQHYFTIDNIMEEVHQKCRKLLLHCEFNKKVKRCSDVFNLVRTAEGYCCAFNYAALNDITEESIFEGDDDIEYYDDRKVGAIITTSKSGRSSGLAVVFDVQENDYPPWSNVTFRGAKILISDPNDFPETTVVTKYIEQGDSVAIMVEPQIFLSDSSLRRVGVQQRSCWFHDEMNLEHTDRYSYETCNTECRMKTALNICGCVPYKYPREKSCRICEFSDLPCLHNLTVYGSNYSCECFLECSDKKYKIKRDITPFSLTDLPRNMLAGEYNLTQVSGLRVYFDKATCTCYKKTLLMDFDRVLGTYGGLFSLCAGGSILTIVEIIFLMLSAVSAAVWKRITGILYYS